MFVKTIPLLLISILTLPFVALSQKTTKKIVSQPNSYAEYKKQFSFVDDPAPVKYLRLPQDSVKYTPKYFYIAQVNDSTGCNDSIGYMLRPKSGKPQKLSFDGGTSSMFSAYMNNKLNKDSTLYPLVFNVTKFIITDERTKPYDKTFIKYTYEFLYPYKNKLEKIASYTGEGTLYTPIGMKKKFDSIITMSLEKQFQSVDEMIGDLNAKSPMFCKGVKLSVTFRTDENTDTIFYNSGRDIDWADFLGDNRNADNTFGSYIGLAFNMEKVDYSNNYYNINITVGASFLKSGSWVGKSAKQPAILQHIRYRLKLAGIHALKFKEKIESTVLSCDNFNSEIRTLYTNAFKDMNADVSKFDRATNYGQNKKEEFKWEDFIDKELEELKK